MDPAYSLVLYAAAYDHRRLPHHFRSGGPGSGIFKTADGGKRFRTPALVRPDPRLQMTEADRETQDHALADMFAAAKKLELCIMAAPTEAQVFLIEEIKL